LKIHFVIGPLIMVIVGRGIVRLAALPTTVGTSR
jgi:hypothetical protein